jgi:hypothetical protein
MTAADWVVGASPPARPPRRVPRCTFRLPRCRRAGGGPRVLTPACAGSSRDAASSCPTLGTAPTRRPATPCPTVRTPALPQLAGRPRQLLRGMFACRGKVFLAAIATAAGWQERQRSWSETLADWRELGPRHCGI